MGTSKKGETSQICRFSSAFSQTLQAWDDPAALPALLQPLQPVCPAPLGEKKKKGCFLLKTPQKFSCSHSFSFYFWKHLDGAKFLICMEQGGVSSTTVQSEGN